MERDEAEIRQLVATWMAATKAGDVETVLSLMTDDVVFLLPGQHSILGKPAFAAAARAQSHQAAPRIDGESEIREIKVLGDWAFMWSKLRVTVTPPGGEPMKRAGFTLSILQKQNGRWLLARDANMLLPVAVAGE
jgi:uncharacterized protein (TIGR02246 family)